MGSFEDLLGAGAASSDSEKDEAAKDLAQKCGYAAAALTLIPFPIASSVAIMPVHVGMFIGIGQIYGVEMTKDSATNLILRIGATVGLSMVGTSIAIEGAKLIPFVGILSGVVGASFSYANTIALGYLARTYFKNQGELTDDEIRSIYKASSKAARKEFDPKRARSQSAKDMASAAVEEAKTKKYDEAREKVQAEEAKPTEADPVARLERLKSLLDKGLIEQAEYDAVKQKILDGI